MVARQHLKSAFILAGCLFGSCKLSLQERKYAGNWESKGSHINEKLTIQRNGHYRHEVFCFCPKYVSYGRWHLSHDTLVLIQKDFKTNDPSDPQYTKPRQDTVFMKIIFVLVYPDKKQEADKTHLTEVQEKNTGKSYYKSMYKRKKSKKN